MALSFKCIQNPTASHLYLLSSSHYYLPTESLQQRLNWFPCFCPNNYLTFNLNTAARDILSMCRWNHVIPLIKILQWVLLPRVEGKAFELASHCPCLSSLAPSHVLLQSYPLSSPLTFSPGMLLVQTLCWHFLCLDGSSPRCFPPTSKSMLRSHSHAAILTTLLKPAIPTASHF